MLQERTKEYQVRWQAEAAKGYPNAMCYHVKRGNLKKLRQMLRWAKADVNAHEEGFTLLMYAVFFGRPEVCRLLLKAGADPSLTVDGGFSDAPPDTALTIAVQEGQELCLEELLNGGAKHDQLEVCALQVAALLGEIGCAKRLIAAGSDTKMLHAATQRTLLHAASTHAGNEACLEFLLDSQADINAVDVDGHSALTLACSRLRTLTDEEAMVRLLLSRGADASVVVYQGQGGGAENALTLAISSKATATVHALLEHGVDPDESPEFAPLTYALSEKSLELVQALRAYGATLMALGERLASEGPRAYPDAPQREAIERWLATTLDYVSPLCYAATGILSQQRAIELLRGGADPFARKHATAPSPLLLAQMSACAGDPSSAAFTILQAARWTPQSHHSFPKPARQRAVELLLLGHRLVAAKHLFLDLWLHVMSFAVEAVEPPICFHPSCQPAPRLGAVPLLAALFARGGSDRALSRCPISQSHIDTAVARLGELQVDGGQRLASFLDGPKGHQLNVNLAARYHARYSGADLRLLPQAEQTAPLAEGTVRILCVGSDAYYEDGRRLSCEWEAPRLVSARRVLALLTLGEH